MKRLAFTAFLSGTAPLLAQLPVTEDFTNNGEGSRYFSNAAGSASDFFQRVTSAQPNNFGAAIGGFDGGMWAFEDVGSAIGGGGDGVVTLATIANAGTFSNRQVTIKFADARASSNRPENNDQILIQVAFDGNISQSGTPGSGSYTTIGRLIGDSPTAAVGGNLREDLNLNGVSSDGDGGAEVTQTLTDFTFDIPNGGTNLSVRIVCDMIGGTEEFAFDDIRVTGMVAATDPPSLAGIETGAINYTEGDPATQLTNSLTVADSDSNIVSATVTIMSGFVAGEDLLEFTPSGGITGTFAGSVLSLSGTASPAAYRTALRSVTYRNSNVIDPDTSPRTITFKVNDGSDDSNGASRQINSVAVLPIGSIPHTESFETNGESITYLSNTFDAGTDHFERHEFGSTGNQHPTHGAAVSGVDGSWAWAGEDVVSASNPLGDSQPGVILIQDLDSTGFSTLQVTLALAHSVATGSGFEASDNIQVQYAFGPNGTDGTDLVGGSYTTIGRFDGAGVGVQFLAVTGASNVSDGTSTTTALQDFTFDIPTTGGNLSIRILDNIDGGTEEHVFDNIRITGFFGPANETPQLAAIESAFIPYAEGAPAVSITNTLTVSDADDTDLEGATVEIIGGFDSTEDELIFTNQNGITAVAVKGVDRS